MILTDITQQYEHTHMAFIATDNHKGYMSTFCLYMNGVWKIHYVGMDNVVHRLNTGLPDDAYECNPVLHYNTAEATWYISFIAGNSVDLIRLSMYYMPLYGESAGDPLIQNVRTGYYIDDKNMAFIRYGNIMNVGSSTSLTPCKLNKAVHTFCLRPCQFGKIVSYTKTGKMDALETLCINIAAKKAYVLTDGDAPMYKACYKDNVWYYAKRLSDNNEDRKIVRAENPILTEVLFDEYIEIGKNIEELDPRAINQRSINSILLDLPKELR